MGIVAVCAKIFDFNTIVRKMALDAFFECKASVVSAKIYKKAHTTESIPENFAIL
jgi:hypothetical protein